MSAFDSCEKKTTHALGDRQEAADRRRGADWQHDRVRGLPGYGGEHGSLLASEGPVFRGQEERTNAGQGT